MPYVKKVWNGDTNGYQFAFGEMRIIKIFNADHAIFIAFGSGYNDGYWMIEEISKITKTVVEKSVISLMTIANGKHCVMNNFFGADYAALPDTVKRIDKYGNNNNNNNNNND
eukprot:CAMPEP_0114683694 /NCGR_PEP_ID=MMETSP0191-20121206/58138_1 /TAXON_ID=126664 /ORGANISM="Sorites sp." /LENGTH=111 /DNA_ID=CAMNT_0001965241 /DNA_START=624 /DNA_END=956 /DNA_ORIENTATION=+